MPVNDVGAIRLPPSVAAWTDTAIYVFLGLVAVWIVLKVIGFALRRSYNLTPAATAHSKNVRPDFLKVDHAAQEQMVERARAFGQPAAVATTATVASWGVVLSGLITFMSAAFLSLGRIEELDATWRNLSAKDRFVAIVQSHPYGFGIAVAMMLAALVRLITIFRKTK
jgi:hypothetical protein